MRAWHRTVGTFATALTTVPAQYLLANSIDNLSDRCEFGGGGRFIHSGAGASAASVHSMETTFALAMNIAAPTWSRWLFLAMAAHAFYCIFNANQRNIVYGEFYRLRFMKRTGSPASARTALIAFVAWLGGFATFFYPQFWEWNYSGVLFIGLFAGVMLSSFLDARNFRNVGW